MKRTSPAPGWSGWLPGRPPVQGRDRKWTEGRNASPWRRCAPGSSCPAPGDRTAGRDPGARPGHAPPGCRCRAARRSSPGPGTPSGTEAEATARRGDLRRPAPARGHRVHCRHRRTRPWADRIAATGSSAGAAAAPLRQRRPARSGSGGFSSQAPLKRATPDDIALITDQPERVKRHTQSACDQVQRRPGQYGRRPPPATPSSPVGSGGVSSQAPLKRATPDDIALITDQPERVKRHTQSACDQVQRRPGQYGRRPPPATPSSPVGFRRGQLPSASERATPDDIAVTTDQPERVKRSERTPLPSPSKRERHLGADPS